MNLPDISVISSAGFPRINQIGILVNDIPEAAAHYSTAVCKRQLTSSSVISFAICRHRA